MRAVWVRAGIAAVVLAVVIGVGWRILVTRDPADDDSLQAADVPADTSSARPDQATTTESTAPTTEPPALPSVTEVTEALSTAYGMTFDAESGVQGDRRSVRGISFDPSTGAEVECVVWSTGADAAARVVLLEAVCRASEDPEALKPTATEYLGFCAQLPLDGADADAARLWIEEGAAVMRSGNSRETDISNSHLQMRAEPDAWYLTVELR